MMLNTKGKKIIKMQQEKNEGREVKERKNIINEN